MLIVPPTKSPPPHREHDVVTCVRAASFDIVSPTSRKPRFRDRPEFLVKWGATPPRNRRKSVDFWPQKVTFPEEKSRRCSRKFSWNGARHLSEKSVSGGPRDDQISRLIASCWGVPNFVKKKKIYFTRPPQNDLCFTGGHPWQQKSRLCFLWN